MKYRHSSSVWQRIETKELASLKYFIGIEVTHSKHGIFIFQRKYINDLLEDIGKLCKPASNLIDPNHKLTLGEESSQ